MGLQKCPVASPARFQDAVCKRILATLMALLLVWGISGEELATVSAGELSEVKDLKQHICYMFWMFEILPEACPRMQHLE